MTYIYIEGSQRFVRIGGSCVAYCYIVCGGVSHGNNLTPFKNTDVCRNIWTSGFYHSYFGQDLKNRPITRIVPFIIAELLLETCHN